MVREILKRLIMEVILDEYINFFKEINTFFLW